VNERVKDNVRVKDIGEQGLLQRLQRFCPADIVGDDAALLTPTPGLELVVTSDMLVDRVHFSDQTTAPEDVGWRAVAANLSDLAAMGASPLGLTIGLGVPGDQSVDWIERLYHGMADCLCTYGTVLVGGDISRAPVRILAITALGQVAPRQAIRRDRAQVGDVILVTGVHGAARAGLELLLNPAWGQDLGAAARQTLIEQHQRPQPRLDVIKILRQQFPDARVAGMDSSDGLADAVLQICRASGVGANLTALPMPNGFLRTQSLDQSQAQTWCLYGGEDFQLVLSLPESIAQQLQSCLDSEAQIIGQITTEPEVYLITASERISLSLNQGFQHFG
jgi:thiamine-monophosphate kinase